MFTNYHSHTWRCGHARGTEREYVEQAIKAGIRILGFADHSPYPMPAGFESDFRMTLEQTEEYFRVLSDLKKEYASQIDIHIGVETEYYPEWHEKYMRFLSRYPCEYMLLGQHFLGLETQRQYCSAPRNREQDLVQYVSQTIEGLSTGCFTYLAHPDILNWKGSTQVYIREMTRLCRSAKEMQIPLEINLLGLYEKRNYPNEVFWKIAGDVENLVILGCDAHTPEALNRPETEKRAEALCSRYRLDLRRELTLHDPFQNRIAENAQKI